MPPEVLDFSRRAEPDEAPEWMDEPCTYEQFRDCLRSLEQVNRVTLAARPTLDFVARIAARKRDGGPLRILDVGSGGGDMLRRIARWARRAQVPVELTGVDMNPYAARAAADFDAKHGVTGIRWLTADALTLPDDAAPDIILSSLFTHHLTSEEIVRFIAWMESRARLGWFINDLARSERSYKLFGLLSRVMLWHQFVQHDGPVSIRRAFRPEDWNAMCRAAGLTPDAYRIVPWFPGRLCVERLRSQPR